MSLATSEYSLGQIVNFRAELLIFLHNLCLLKQFESYTAVRITAVVYLCEHTSF